MPIRVFISYAREDLEHLKALETHLANLKRQGVIEVWTDQKLLASTEWSSELLGRLRGAHIVLVLISPDMMASDFIHDIELKETLKRHEKGKVRVVPVRVRPTELEGHPLATLTWLPKQGQPVTRCPDRDDAWVEVATAVRELVKSLGPEQPGPTSPERRELSRDYRALLERIRRLEVSKREPSLLASLKVEARTLRQRLLEGNIRPEDVLDSRYRILRKLGEGGFASVWLADDQHQDRLVALKVLHSSLISDESRRERFERGSRAMSRLSHAGIIQVLEPYQVSGDEPGSAGTRHYVVLEWAEQGDLFQWLRRENRALVARLDRVLEVAEALEYAHQQQTIHRDVKPHNIVISKEGRAQLTDFDLAKLVNSNLLSQSNMRAGSAYYGAPEVQVTRVDGTEPKPVGPPADVYGLGMTLLSLLLGRELNVTDLRRLEGLVGQHVPEVLQPLLLKAIEVDPADRYPTMHAFREALMGVRAQVRELLKEPSAPPQRPGPVRLSPGPVLTPAEALEAELVRLPLAERLLRLEEVGRTGDPRLGLEKPQNWIWIEPGAFMMGDDHGWRPAHEPAHPVSLPSGFYITRYPITNHDFALFWDEGVYRQQKYWSESGWAEKRGGGPGKSYDKTRSERSNHPVVNVSWWQAEAFAAYLQQNIHLLAPMAQHNDKAWAVRLPTEAEWEYVARGEQNRWFPWGQTERFEEHANVQELNQKDTTPVGTFLKGQSSQGVLDLIGNVWEWCADWYSRYPKEHQVSPWGPSTGPDKILRGGAFDTPSDNVKSFTRSWQWPHKQQSQFGFRLVRSPLSLNSHGG